MLAALVSAIIVGLLLFRDQLSLEALAGHEATLRESHSSRPLLSFLIAFLLYVTVTALSLPFATALTLIIAWLFGFWPALLLVSFGSTLGATLAFLISRYLFRDAMQERFGERIESFNEALRREGAFYLFTLRLIPAVPFFVINVVMGLTPIRVRTFWIVSQVGMLAGTAVYVYFGANVPSLEKLVDRGQLSETDIISWPLLVERLQEADSATDDRFTTRLVAALPADAAQVLRDTESAKGLSEADREIVLAGLNTALKKKSLLARDKDESDDVIAVTQRNREALVSAWSDVVRSIQPILRWQLLLALVLLGVFPLLAKKLMDAIMRSRIEADTGPSAPDGVSCE